MRRARVQVLAQPRRERLRFLLFLCAAMVLRVRDALLSQEFAENLQLLQSYPRDIDCEEVRLSLQVCCACPKPSSTSDMARGAQVIFLAVRIREETCGTGAAGNSP